MYPRTCLSDEVNVKIYFFQPPLRIDFFEQKGSRTKRKAKMKQVDKQLSIS